jgi:uncharacterized protein
VEEVMKNAKFVAVLALGLMAGVCVTAQTQEAAQTPAVTALPEDQQATKEQITKLFEVMRLRQQMDLMMKMIPEMAQQAAQQQQKAMLEHLPSGAQLTPEQQEKLNKFTQQMVEKVVSTYPIDEIISDAIGVYQRHIRREDADAMIAFYNSPAGQHLLDAQPVIAREYMPMVMERMKDLNKTMADDMAKEMKDFIATLTATKN